MKNEQLQQGKKIEKEMFIILEHMQDLKKLHEIDKEAGLKSSSDKCRNIDLFQNFYSHDEFFVIYFARAEARIKQLEKELESL